MKYSLCLLRAPLTCTVPQDKGLAHKTDAHTAFLNAVSWSKPGFFYSWDTAQNRSSIPTITSDYLSWYLVNPVSVLGCSQLCSACGVHLLSWNTSLWSPFHWGGVEVFQWPKWPRINTNRALKCHHWILTAWQQPGTTILVCTDIHLIRTAGKNLRDSLNKLFSVCYSTPSIYT